MMVWVAVAHMVSPLDGIPTMYPFLSGVYLDVSRCFSAAQNIRTRTSGGMLGDFLR